MTIDSDGLSTEQAASALAYLKAAADAEAAQVIERRRHALYLIARKDFETMVHAERDAKERFASLVPDWRRRVSFP